MLGTGGRLYLDGDLGEVGCNYGVHTDTGWWVTLMEEVPVVVALPIQVPGDIPGNVGFLLMVSTPSVIGVGPEKPRLM